MPNDWRQRQKNAYSFLEKNVTMCKLVKKANWWFPQGQRQRDTQTARSMMKSAFKLAYKISCFRYSYSCGNSSHKHQGWSV